MKTTSKFITLFLITLGLIISSCKKGDTGSQGATGPQGASGPSAKYVDITANFDGTSSYINYPIYQDGFENGDMVVVYFQDPAYNPSVWLIQTPYTWYNSTSTPFAYFWTEIASASIFIYAQKPGFSVYTPAFTVATTQKFRAVIIKTSHLNVKPTLPDDLSYQSIKTYCNLKD